MSTEYYKKIVKDIDQWLDQYEGNDEKLIDRKLDQQEEAIKQIKLFQNAFVNSN
jgi:hypothetical protein